MTSIELRQKFLEFFNKKGHAVLPSSSLVPSEVDPSVLFTTAGMQQFKRYYLEPEEAPASRVATCQKCIRTGDIDEVGDKTHHTFFEMLGNFSFGYPQKEGSYFKKEAIEYAWEFLTQVLNIDPKRIHATYFTKENNVSTDEESKKILEGIEGLEKIIPQGFDDNFWSLGTENSPGGPTVEFYIDNVEVWNLVFNEYIFKNQKFEPSEFKGVDTGMGLERLIALLENINDNYQTDLFAPIIKEIEQLSGKGYLENHQVFRIIADHIKAATLAISDGVLPSNKDRGYILRRLIRRAIVKASQIGINDNFTQNIAREVFATYKGIYFDVISSVSEKSDSSRQASNNIELILSELEKEEIKFRNTLKGGLRLLESKTEISSKDLFDLYQSYGLPLEISIEELKNRSIKVNDSTIEQFNNLMHEHQEKSRTASAGMFKGGLADSGEETRKLHTAAHLMLAALRKVLGEGVFQKGSNITPERLRFDFSYPEKMTDEQIQEVEKLVNEQIEKDIEVNKEEMSIEDAKACGAMGVFDAKYGEKVTVYQIGGFSNEICGGPHANRTGELGHFKIVKEESSSAGVRRIKAIL